MIVDSSAILAILFREAGAEDLRSAIVGADFAGIGAPTAADCMTSATAAVAGQPLLCRVEDFPKTDLVLR